MGARGDFNNQTGPLIYINLHVKYGSNLIRTFWVKIQNIKKKKIIFLRGHVGPLHKIQEYLGAPKCQQMQTSSQWRHMYKGKQLTTSFSYMGQNVKKLYFFHIWALLSNPGLPNFQGSKTSSEQKYNKASQSLEISLQQVQNLTQFFLENCFSKIKKNKYFLHHPPPPHDIFF